MGVNQLSLVQAPYFARMMVLACSVANIGELFYNRQCHIWIWQNLMIDGVICVKKAYWTSVAQLFDVIAIIIKAHMFVPMENSDVLIKAKLGKGALAGLRF